MNESTVVSIHFIGGSDFIYSHPIMDEEELSAFKSFLLDKNIEIAEFFNKKYNRAVSFNKSNIAYIEYYPSNNVDVEYPTSDE